LISIQHKRFQVVLWETEDRSGSSLHLEFDTLEEARAALEAQQQLHRYRTGILMEWHKMSGVWNLIARFPE